MNSPNYNLTIFTHTSSVDTKMQDSGFKLLTRWYRVSTKLARLYPTLTDICWRGCGLRGTFLHIWWECAKLRPYWQDIGTQVKVILDLEISDSSLELLLHVPLFLLAITVNRSCPIFWMRLGDWSQFTGKQLKFPVGKNSEQYYGFRGMDGDIQG